MLKESLVYIRKIGAGEPFVGCGAFVEQNLIVTCRHVWRDADETAEAVFPFVWRDGAAAVSALDLVDACNAADGVDPDLVLLRATHPPDGLTHLQIARSENHECGEARALARLPTRETDDEIPGTVSEHIDSKRRRRLSQTVATGYWFERGSSGSPVFVGIGQQLAGLVSMAELGQKPQNAPIRVAYVVPGTIIWPFVYAVARRELGARERAIQQELLKENESGSARELIFEIARRSGGDGAAAFEQALANARAAFEEGRKAIEAGARGGNLGALVDNLLRKIAARTQAGDFAGGAAEADRAFAEWKSIEAERHEASVAVGVRILSEGARQDMLRRDFRAAAERTARIVELQTPDPGLRFKGMRVKQDEFYAEGRDKGNNASLEVAIEVALIQLQAGRDADERGLAGNDLGLALETLGRRESGTTRLEDAVAAYRAALLERTRERVPLDWASTLNNLGAALQTIGEREGGTARLEEAIVAYRAALEEGTREQVPLDWARTQNNLGNALLALGEREGETAKLEEAVLAYRAALEERTRERVPLDWAMTQTNLGNALLRLGERESGTTRLEEAVASYSAALEERTRERVPLDWAMTQMNLGNALQALGKRRSGTARLEDAVAAYRAALKERTRERVPLDWAMTQNNLGNALWRLGERESGTTRLEEAVAAYRAALEERTRARVPLQWAGTQNNLGNALWRFGERESETSRVEEAVAAYRAALEERTRERVPLDWAATQHNLGSALLCLGEWESGTSRLEAAVAAYGEALKESTRERAPLDWAASFGDQGVAMMMIADRTGDATLIESALTQIETAYETLRDGDHATWAAEFQEQLPKARAIRDRLKDN
jgi:tetratricopeptide (TPR) repeat protein